VSFFHKKEYKYCAYEGWYYYRDPNGIEKRNYIKNRIMIDHKEYNTINSQYSRIRHKKEKNEIKEKAYEEFLISPFLKGYDLYEYQIWVTFCIDSISEIKFNKQAYDELIIPGDDILQTKKETIFKLLKHFNFRNTDVVANKNSGRIHLFHGHAGVGKSLTPQTAGEFLELPLLYISAGNLTTESGHLEHNFKMFQNLAQRWKAIVQLDEADVFLEARDSHNLIRNALVGTFLKILEFFNGILFLTTNRSVNFDPAVPSRVHVTVHFQDLTEEHREIIWKNMMKHSAFSDKASPDIGSNYLKYRALNGRQLRTICNVAESLAQQSGSTINESHVKLACQLNMNS